MSANDSTSAPLCVDCDGTLLRTDLLHESTLALLKQSPLSLFMIPLWLLSGRAYLKEQVAQRVRLDIATLPVRHEVIEHISTARAAGRQVVLATASHETVARQINDELKLFDDVIATGGNVNLSGPRKADALARRYGHRAFDYIGDSTADLPVWAVSRSAIVVATGSRLVEQARKVAQVERVMSPERPGLLAYLRAMRVHQWAKNLLVFVPLVAAHVDALDGWLQAGLAFLSFGFCASAVYVVNDLLDLESDRRHVRKRTRAFAAGLIPVWHGTLAAPALLAAAFIIAAWLPLGFTIVLAAYFLLTLAYSLWLKRRVVVDVLMLAGLYTMRIVAGAAAIGVVPSFWLLEFSVFLFLSLALIKRYTELRQQAAANGLSAAGRGYRVDDLPVLLAVGAGSGMVAVQVFALFINAPTTLDSYSAPMRLWLIPPVLLYWIIRIWMKAHRGEVHDDPLVFALRDWQSLLAAIACTTVVWAAR